MRVAVWSFLSMTVVVGLGCTGPTASASVDEQAIVDEPAVIRFYQETRPIVIPDTVIRGVPFEVRVPTYAGGCTQAIARTEVQVRGAVVEIRPVNRTVTVPGGGCTRDLRVLEHRAMITVTTVSPVLVRIRGAERNAATGNATSSTVIERQIVVRSAA